jgi:hypothetical protein
MLSRLLTKSRLGAFRSCQRFHDIQYRQGYRPVDEAGPLRFGSLIHLGLEQIWKGEPLALPVEADPWDLAKARPMLAGYLARWRENDAATLDVLGVEVPFECPLVNPTTGAESKTWRLAGKIDAIVRERSSGRVLIIEHKSSAQSFGTGSSYLARLRMDQQISVYMVGAKSLGHDPVGVIYDILGKPRIRPLEVNSKRTEPESAAAFDVRCTAAIGEAPNNFYARAEVVRLEAEISDAMGGVWDQAQQMREAERLGRDIPNPDACERWGRLCDFFPFCSGETGLDNQRLYSLRAEAHPELADVVGPS